jgi:RNA polymerase sigma factor (sigma-70 family)
MGSGEQPAESTHSVTELIGRLKEQHSQAAEEIWRRYFERLVPLARARIKAMPQRVTGEEDVLISVFDRFFRAVKENKFSCLDDRDDLWQILVMLTERSATDHFRRAHAEKRGAGQVVRQGDLADIDLAQIRELADREPSPEIVAAFNDTLAQAMLQLEDPTTREIALLRMEGHENGEIASRLEISLSSVERKLRVIRTLWKRKFGARTDS